MEMSHAYMKETAVHLTQFGFELTTSEEVLETLAEGDCTSIKYDLLRQEGTHFILETVVHPKDGESYYLEIVEHFGLKSFSFVLDSWKHRPDRIEFKYYAMPSDGRGLSFVFRLDPG